MSHSKHSQIIHDLMQPMEGITTITWPNTNWQKIMAFVGACAEQNPSLANEASLILATITTAMEQQGSPYVQERIAKFISDSESCHE